MPARKHRPRGEKGLVQAAITPPMAAIRLQSGLSRAKMAAAIGYSLEGIARWERGERPPNLHANRLAMHVLWFCKVDPVNGWMKFALGLPPWGKIPPELAQKLAQPPGDMVQVPAYQRVKRKERTIKDRSQGKSSISGVDQAPTVEPKAETSPTPAEPTVDPTDDMGAGI